MPCGTCASKETRYYAPVKRVVKGRRVIKVENTALDTLSEQESVFFSFTSQNLINKESEGIFFFLLIVFSRVVR